MQYLLPVTCALTSKPRPMLIGWQLQKTTRYHLAQVFQRHVGPRTAKYRGSHIRDTRTSFLLRQTEFQSKLGSQWRAEHLKSCPEGALVLKNLSTSCSMTHTCNKRRQQPADVRLRCRTHRAESAALNPDRSQDSICILTNLALKTRSMCILLHASVRAGTFVNPARAPLQWL